MTPLRELMVPADWVARRDLGPFDETFGTDVAPAAARELQGAVMFTFPEIEDQAESLYAVPGVLDWFHELYRVVPHMPYYLVTYPDAGALQSLLFAGLPESERAAASATGQVDIAGDLQDWLVERMLRTAAYATQMGDDWARVVSEFLAPLGDGAEIVVDLITESGVAGG